MTIEQAMETLENLLKALCSQVEKTQHNAQQTLYTLQDITEAKLAYDVLVMCQLEVKYFSDESCGKLYVQNASLVHAEPKLQRMMDSVELLRKLKETLDCDYRGTYSLSYSQSPVGKQFAVLFHEEKQHSIAPDAPPSAPLSAVVKVKSVGGAAPVKRSAPQEEVLSSGPEVGRKAIPKSLKVGEGEEDGPFKRFILYASGRAFTSGAWMVFIALIMGIIFTVLVTIKGFLCPDVATDQQTVPSYCPKKAVRQQQEP